jgi:hypothetical protein
MRLSYLIDGRPCEIEVDDDMTFEVGDAECLATRFDDVTRGQPWFPKGYAIVKTADYYDHAALKDSVEAAVARILADEAPGLALDAFRLEDYHRYVDEARHERVIARTRRLYPEDLAFDTDRVVRKLSELLGAPLSYRNTISGNRQWLISRLNRPGSTGYNPVHKDIYGPFDRVGAIGRMVNVWIPVCGVGDGTGLPVVPGSHLLTEDRIERTRAGALMNGLSYTVNCIRSWDGSNTLEALCPGPDEMLVFSSHLIHGLGLNHKPDTTRVSLEFRLFDAAGRGD